jgi:hypothetical protein
VVLPILEQSEIYIRLGGGGSLPLAAATRYGLEPPDPQAPGGALEGPALNDLRRPGYLRRKPLTRRLQLLAGPRGIDLFGDIRLILGLRSFR